MKERAAFNALDDWRRRKKISYRQLAVICERHGWYTTASYLNNIILGHHQVGWAKAKVLSEVTKGEVSATEILEIYSRRQASKKKVNDAA
jgi:hypothetical protein